MRRELWLSLSCAVTLAACNCGGVSIDDFPERAAKAYCTQVYACCSAAETHDAGSVGPDQASCISNLKGQLAGNNGVIKTEQTKGRVAWRGDLADTCLQKLAALKCQDLKVNATATPSECTHYLEPKTAVGAACGLSESCVSSTCAGASASQDGVCTAFINEGLSCDAGVCVSTAFCDGTKTCVRLKTDGVSCGNNFECETGGCNGKDAGTPGSCGVKGGAGTTCFIAPGCSVTGPGTAIAALLVMLVLVASRRRS